MSSSRFDVDAWTRRRFGRVSGGEPAEILALSRRAVIALLAGWAGWTLTEPGTAPKHALAGKRGRRRKRRKRRAQERLCQAVCGASCATCRQRCSICNEFQVCFHLPNSTQPRCDLGVIPDDCELCSVNANCDPGSFCVKGFTSAGSTGKISGCTYSFGVCMEELP